MWVFIDLQTVIDIMTLMFWAQNLSLNNKAKMCVIYVCPQVEVLQEELAYATEEVGRLTKVLDDQNSLLQASQEQTAQKDVMLQNLQQKVSLNCLNTENIPKIIKVNPMDDFFHQNY